MKDYYSILEINESASKEVIEKVYKLLVKKYHPDLQKEEDKKYAEEKMQEINEAYELLSDPIKRQRYNIQLKEYKIKEIINQIKSEYEIKNEKNSNYNNEQEIRIYNENVGQKNYLDENEIRRLAQIYYEELCDAYNKANVFYQEPFAQRLKTFFKNIIALFFTGFIIYFILQIPYIRNIVNDWINSNVITKAVLGRFFN